MPSRSAPGFVLATSADTATKCRAGRFLPGIATQFAVSRKYIAESPAAGVRHFDERRERPANRMLTVEEEQSIFETAPPYLRVAIVLLVQTGGRRYSEGLSLGWDQVELENQAIHLAGELETSESAQPVWS